MQNQMMELNNHLIEDTAITIGQTIDKALSSRSGITRFSYASVPMDESPKYHS